MSRYGGNGDYIRLYKNGARTMAGDVMIQILLGMLGIAYIIQRVIEMSANDYV